MSKKKKIFLIVATIIIVSLVGCCIWAATLPDTEQDASKPTPKKSEQPKEDTVSVKPTDEEKKRLEDEYMRLASGLFFYEIGLNVDHVSNLSMETYASASGKNLETIKGLVTYIDEYGKKRMDKFAFTSDVDEEKTLSGIVGSSVYK